MKKKENVEYPSDVLLVEHADLVVIRTIRPETKQSQKKFSKTLKNMKIFRKVFKGLITRCNFPCNLHCNTLGRCKIGKYKFPSQFANLFFNILNICHKFRCLKSRIALQLARKIAPCDGALKSY